MDKSQNHSKKSISALPILDLPTHEEKPSREVITFSPNNAEANWYFNPAQNSKRSSANQSLKFPKNSFSTELMQGSALLAHAANHHFPSEISLSQIRDNAPIFDEIHRLKSELTNLKVAFRSEQSMHEETKKELFQCSNALQDVEVVRIELEDKNMELEEKIKLLTVKIKNPESLEQLRGKSLEYARMEIKQLKNYLSEKDRKIEDLKHALSQKTNMENNSARDKEIDDLTYEITRLKLVNTSQNKQIKELYEKVDKESKNKDSTTGELKNIIENYDNKFKKLQEKLKEEQKTLEEKIKEIEKLTKKNKELKQLYDTTIKEKEQDIEELTQAKETIEVLKKQLSGTHYEKTTSADYDYQLNKFRSVYEKKLEDANDEINKYKSKCSSYENKISLMEAKISKLTSNSDDSYNAEDKETILVLQEEIKNITTEFEELTKKNIELKGNERKYIEEIENLRGENDEIINEFDIKTSELKDQIQELENKQLENSKNLRKADIDSQNSRDLLRQYGEEMEQLRYAKKQAEQLNEVYKRQLEELKNNECTNKLKAREEIEHEILKLQNSMKSLTAKSQFEKDELYQKLREKDQEIFELKQELEESYNINEEKIQMDMNYFKEKIEKEKDEEIKRIKKIYSNQNGTQTSFDYSTFRDEIKTQIEAENHSKLAKQQLFIEEKLKKEMYQDIREKVEQELLGRYKQISASEKESYENRIEEINYEYTKKVENLKAEYSKNALNMEQDFMNKVKSIENEYSNAMKKTQMSNENIGKIEDLELLLKQKSEEMKLLQKKIRDYENQIFENNKLLLKPSGLINSQDELDVIIRKAKDEVKLISEKEKQDLIEEHEKEKNDLRKQKEKALYEIKKKDDQLEDAKNKEKNMLREFEVKLEETKANYLSEIDDYKIVYSNDIKETEKNFLIKEKRMEKEFQDKIQELTQEYQEKIEKSQEKYTEMMSKKDILSKADNQRVKEEVAITIADKERELNEQFNKRQKLLKAQFDKDMKCKENELESLKENLEGEKKKFKEEYAEKINILKQENLRNKREWEREQKKLKELVENAMENAKKELELVHLENINKEKAECDRKEKNKLKIINSKHQKELLDKEQMIKSEAEIEKNLAIQELSESYKLKIKQIQEDQKKYYEELKTTALEEKAHEIEIKVRRELQDGYLKTISQMDSQHFQEKERLREEFRIELSKRIEEIRSYSYGDYDNSYMDLPFSNRRQKNTTDESQDLKNQIENYKQKIDQLELEKENERFSIGSDLEKFKNNEYNKIVHFIQDELNCYFSKPIPKPKNMFPEISGLIRAFFNKIDIETDLVKEKTRQEFNLELIRSSGEHKRRSISQNMLNIEIEDIYFLKYHDKLYISLEKSIEDLLRIKKQLSEKTQNNISEHIPLKDAKEGYFSEIANIYKLIPFVMENNYSKNTSAEDREKLKKYDQELKTLTQEYRLYVLRSKE